MQLFGDFLETANMLPVLLIYQNIGKYVFLEHCNNVKKKLTDVIKVKGGKTYLRCDFCLLGHYYCIQTLCHAVNQPH